MGRKVKGEGKEKLRKLDNWNCRELIERNKMKNIRS